MLSQSYLSSPVSTAAIPLSSYIKISLQMAVETIYRHTTPTASIVPMKSRLEKRRVPKNTRTKAPDCARTLANKTGQYSCFSCARKPLFSFTAHNVNSSTIHSKTDRRIFSPRSSTLATYTARMVFENCQDPDAVTWMTSEQQAQTTGKQEIWHFQEMTVSIPSIQPACIVFAIAARARRYSHALIVNALAPPFRIGRVLKRLWTRTRFDNGSSYSSVRKQNTDGPPRLNSTLSSGRLDDSMHISPTDGAIVDRRVGVRPSTTCALAKSDRSCGRMLVWIQSIRLKQVGHQISSIWALFTIGSSLNGTSRQYAVSLWSVVR